jgi:hypothetical protein
MTDARATYEATLIERLNSTYPNTDPNRCAHCGRLETKDLTLLPIGWGEKHTWLHSSCWGPWRELRQSEAIDQLAAVGIAKP